MIEDFLKEYCEQVPDNASNEVCFRVNANKLYEGYKTWCESLSLQPISGSDFVREVASCFPKAKLSDFRKVWGFEKLQKEFDGIALIKTLAESWQKTNYRKR